MNRLLKNIKTIFIPYIIYLFITMILGGISNFFYRDADPLNLSILFSILSCSFTLVILVANLLFTFWLGYRVKSVIVENRVSDIVYLGLFSVVIKLLFSIVNITFSLLIAPNYWEKTFSFYNGAPMGAILIGVIFGLAVGIVMQLVLEIGLMMIGFAFANAKINKKADK